MDLQLDRLDLQILSALQESNQISANDLADQVALSPSAIQRRIRNYRTSGVITADISVVNPRITGDKISVILMIQLAKQGPNFASAFRQALNRSSHVQVIMEIAGPYDLMCITLFDNVDQFNSFIDDEIADHPSVARHEATFVRRRVKFGAAIPL